MSGVRVNIPALRAELEWKREALILTDSDREVLALVEAIEAARRLNDTIGPDAPENVTDAAIALESKLAAFDFGDAHAPVTTGEPR